MWAFVRRGGGLSGTVYALPALYLLAVLLLFAVLRLLLYVAYHADFAHLGLGAVLYGFVRGLRFDLSIGVVSLGGFLWLAMLPLPWAAARWWRHVCLWPAFAVLVVLALAGGCDLFYFQHVHRHIGPEIAAMGLGGDWAFVFAMAFGPYLWALLITVAVLGALGWLHYLLLKPSVRAPAVRDWRAWLASLLLAGLAVLAVRGGVTQKPLNIVNAFDGVGMEEGYLALNGPFALVHSLRAAKPSDVRFMPPEEALAAMQGLLASPHEVTPNAQQPVQRWRTPLPLDGRPAQPNVLVLLLESFEADKVDVLRRRNGLGDLGLSPRFDALAARGRLFDHFYANGQRSIEGIQTVLTGWPPLPGIPYLGTGLEQNRLSPLPAQLRAGGYQSFFIRGASRHSYRCDAIAPVVGFDHYWGAEDIRGWGGNTHGDHPQGVWDEDLFTATQRAISQVQQPFFGFVFTLTAHGPWQVPSAQWEGHGTTSSRERYLNTVAYTDAMLGGFMAWAEQQPWFANTYVLILADHCQGSWLDAPSASERHRIPLLIIGPGIAPGVESRTGSQTDISATVLDLAGVPGWVAGPGRSLIEPAVPDQQFALCMQGAALLGITPQGWIAQSGSNTVAADGPDAAQQAARHQALAVQQVLTQLAMQNRIAAADATPPAAAAAHAGSSPAANRPDAAPMANGSTSPSGATHPGSIAFSDHTTGKQWSEAASALPQTMAWVLVDDAWVAVTRIEVTGTAEKRRISSFAADGSLLESTIQGPQK